MLTTNDLDYILKNLPEDNSDEGAKVRKKLDLLHNQMSLQQEFQERSLELRKQMDDLAK